METDDAICILRRNEVESEELASKGDE